MWRGVMLHPLAGSKILLAGRRRRRVSDSVPAANRGQCGIRQLRAARQQFLMDSHQIPLALVEKLQDLLPVRLGLLRTLQLRHSGGVRAQDFAYGHAGDPQHPCDLAFAHFLRIQFQNRGALRLAQHVVCSPVGLPRRCEAVAFEYARSDIARLSIAGDPPPLPPPPPAAAGRGSQSPPPFPGRVTVRRRSRPVLSPALAAAFRRTAREHPECACGWWPNLCATRHTRRPLGANRNDAGRRAPPSAGNPPGFGAPPAPGPSWLPAPPPCLRAPAAGSHPAEAPPVPAAATPNSRCDRTGAPTHPARSRSPAPTPPPASPPPTPSPARSAVAIGPAPRPQLRSSAISPLPLCPGPVAPAPRSACSRRSPRSVPPRLRLPPPQWAFAGRFRPATPTTDGAAPHAAPAGAPSAARAG